VLVQKNQAKQKKFPEYEILKSEFLEKYFIFLTFLLFFLSYNYFSKKLVWEFFVALQYCGIAVLIPQYCSIDTSVFCLTCSQYFSIATPLLTSPCDQMLGLVIVWLYQCLQPRLESRKPL
jgi:hypothetical protein